MSEESAVESNNGGGMTIFSPSCELECRQRQFPDGLRVLAVDDDVVFLKTLTRLLQLSHYHVVAKSNSAEALMLLKKKEDKFDVVLTDVQMQEIDGFKLLKAALELDIPVVMVSASDNRDVIMKGIRHGARDFLVKPLSEKEVKNIWQHVYRKHLLPCTCMLSKRAGDDDHCLFSHQEDPNVEELEDNTVDFKSGVQSKRSQNKRKRGDDDDDDIAGCGSGSGIVDEVMALLGEESGGKRERLKWTQPLHDKFVDAVEALGGVDKAVPKKILELMSDPDISREKVASHLQKFRKAMKKNQELEKTHNKISTRNSNNNNNNNRYSHHHPPPPPPRPPHLANNNNYIPFRGPVGGSYPTSYNSNNNNYPPRQPMRQLKNWMAHGAGSGYPPQTFQPVGPSICNPMMIKMMQQQPRVMQQQQIMEIAPGSYNNFQQQQNNLKVAANLGQDCFELIETARIQADDQLVKLDPPQANFLVDPSFNDLLVSFYDENLVFP